MATVVKMPKWGLTMTVGTITDWLIEEGSEVAEGDPIFTVETEKAVNDVEAPSAGVLVRKVAGTGDEVLVSNAVAILAAPGETLTDDDIAALIGAGRAVSVIDEGAPARLSETRTARTTGRDDSGRINASPAARRLAGELGLDLTLIAGTGPDGRITSDDVELAAAQASIDPTPRVVSLPLRDGRELSALRAGAGDGLPIVFLHGLGGSQSTWQVVLAGLVEGHQTIAIDLPGHGASSADPESDYSIAGLASAVLDALESLDLKRPVIVGHSLGGAIALKIASARPDQVAGVVAIDSAGLGASVTGGLAEVMSGEPGDETTRALLALFFDDPKWITDRAVGEMVAIQSREGVWPAQQNVAARSFAGSNQTGDIRIDPESISCPVLLVWGENDRVFPVDQAIKALVVFADAQLAIIPAVGHVPQVEASDRTAALIGRFAKSLH